MNLFLKREPTLIGKVTLGDLYLLHPDHKEWLCHTLEDAVRELPGVPVYAWKIKGITAIPSGRYAVKMVNSARFGPRSLGLDDVPGFGDIRIHGGNKPEDTEGCPLVGAKRAGASIYDCATALDALKRLVFQALESGEVVWLTIENHNQDSQSKAT